MNTQFLTVRTMLTMTNEPTDAHKKSLKEEIMNEIIELVMEKLQDIVKQEVQDELKQYQDTTNKKLKKTVNELRQDCNSKVKQRRL
jgi:hypothetical protein